MLPPEFFVFPVAIIQSLHKPGGWGKVHFRHIDDLETYRDNWQQVAEFLASTSGAQPSNSLKPTPLRGAAEFRR